MAVSYGEVHGFPKSRWVNGEFFGTRKLRCAWADRADLLEELDGAAWPYADGPYADESDGGNSYAIAREATIEPLPAQLTADGNMASYEYAIVTVKYSTVGPQLHSTNWIEENLDTTVITQRIDYRGLAWGDGTDLTSLEAPYKILHGLIYSIKYYNVTAVPAAVLTYVGYINSNQVTASSLGLNFAAGKLLYAGARLSHRSSWAGSWLWDVTYYFKYHPAGWNYFWRASTNQYELIDGFTPYPSASFL